MAGNALEFAMEFKGGKRTMFPERFGGAMQDLNL
jgi:hypothetical protein